MSPGGLVFLHGFLGDARDFDNLTHASPSIALDLPGHGSAPPPPAGIDFEQGVELVRHRVEELGLGRCHLVGYSMGGRIALALLRQSPDLVASVTAIGAHAGIEDAEQRARRFAADLDLADRLEREGLEPFLEAWYRLDLFASLRRQAAFLRILERRRAGRAEALAAALRTFSTGGQPPLGDDLAATSRPILLIAGAGDAKYVQHNAELAARSPRIECHTVPDSGHSVHLENPRELVSILTDFLARL